MPGRGDPSSKQLLSEVSGTTRLTFSALRISPFLWGHVVYVEKFGLIGPWVSLRRATDTPFRRRVPSSSHSAAVTGMTLVLGPSKVRAIPSSL